MERTARTWKHNTDTGIQYGIGHNSAVRPDDVDRFNRKRFGAVLGKHANDHVEHDVCFGEVGGGAFDEDILCV